MQELVQEGLSNLCRLCGEDDRECFDLFDDERQEEELLFKIEQSVRIAITQGDGLPTGICTLCHDKLTGYATFYQQCHDTQDRLQEFLSIECAMQKSIQGNQDEEATNDDDYDHDDEHNYEAETEEVYYYEEEGPDNGVEDMEVVEAVEAGAAEEADGSYMITEIHQDNTEERSLEAERMMSSPISIVVEDLQEMTSTQNTEEEINEETASITSSKTNTKLVYLIKNAGDMPVESVLSAVLGGSGSQSSPKTHPPTLPMTGYKMRKVRAKKRKHSPVDSGASQKVVIKGSDGKENMIFLDLDMPVKVELQVDSEDVDDPTWAPTNSDRAGSRSSTWSKLKRARSAVRNSMRTLRLPKPHKKRDTRKEGHKGSASQRHIIQKDDPNYAVMMEKFAKPVSVSTMKRHGLYRPKTNGYKIDAPYKKDVAPYIEKISDTEYKCKICLTAKFRWNYKAEIHILEHLDWRPFECEVCGRAFTQNQYLTKHKRLHFPDDTNFMCEVCGKGFQRRYYLTYHMDEHFEKTYTCEECGRKFTRRQKHDEHVRYHHKCHYSVCDICGQTLRTTALSRHRKQHGEKSERKKKENSSVSNWLSCNVCGRAFRSVRERDDHEAEHSNSLLPFHCEECAVYFKTKRTLTNHIMHAHSQVTEEECEVDAAAAGGEECEVAINEEECEVTTGEEECEVATHVLDELSSTIIVSIPEEL